MRVLIAPLDWGLGHATRCIPLIRSLERAGHTVVICAGGGGERLLRAEFPYLTVETLPGYAMRYTRTRALLPLWLLAQLPLFLAGVWRDGVAARRLAEKHGAGLVIADGRYGFRAARGSNQNPGIPTVFVTHQVEIEPPGPAWMRALMTPVLRAVNRRALRDFAEVWIPDFPGAMNLSGSLGHPRETGARAHGKSSARNPRPKLEYIRPLCRFRPEDLPWNRTAAERPAQASSVPKTPSDSPLRIDILALVSGPEPQRSLFEETLRKKLSKLAGTRVLVRGVPGPASAPVVSATPRPGEFTVFDHLPGERLQALLARADKVVCRSGYTTLMELAGLGTRNVLLVPTPGQPEQESLAVHAWKCGFAAWRDQDALDVEGGLRAASALPGFSALSTSGDGGGDGFDLAAWIRMHPLLRPR